HFSTSSHSCAALPFFFFFFFSYGDHRVLHSFPTRRSSDLCPACGCNRSARSPARWRSRADRRDSHRTRYRRCPARCPGRQFPSRSEEHTSELQSPYDLVCRLLLEKKKKQKQNN